MRLCPLILAVFALVAPACDDCTPERPCCDEGDSCRCPSGVQQCDLACGENCELECATGDRCALSCGADCAIDCSDMPECEASCGADCDLRCASVSSCDVEVGDGSTVSCENAGHCSILCTGSCRVEARSYGGIDVSCRQTDGTTLPAPACDGTYWACGGC